MFKLFRTTLLTMRCDIRKKISPVIRNICQHSCYVWIASSVPLAFVPSAPLKGAKEKRKSKDRYIVDKENDTIK